MSTVLTILIVAAFVVTAIWAAGTTANTRKRIAADHAYRMAKLENDEDEKIHRRYLEAAAADHTPSEIELTTRTAEAAAKKAEADIALVKERARRSRY